MPTTLHPLCGSPHSSCTNYVSPMRFDGTDGCISSMYSSSPSSSVSSAHCAFFCHDMPSGCTNGVSYTCLTRSCTTGVSYTCFHCTGGRISSTCFSYTSGCISYLYSSYSFGYVSSLPLCSSFVFYMCSDCAYSHTPCPSSSNGVDACPSTFVLPSCFVLPSWSVLCCRFLRFPHPSTPGCYHHPAVPPLYSCHDPFPTPRSRSDPPTLTSTLLAASTPSSLPLYAIWGVVLQIPSQKLQLYHTASTTAVARPFCYNVVRRNVTISDTYATVMFDGK